MKRANQHGVAESSVDMDKIDLTVLVEAAQWVAWHYSLVMPILRPGDMIMSYMHSYGNADPIYRLALARAFPIVAGFMDAVRREDTEQVGIIKHLALYGVIQRGAPDA